MPTFWLMSVVISAKMEDHFSLFFTLMKTQGRTVIPVAGWVLGLDLVSRVLGAGASDPFLNAPGTFWGMLSHTNAEARSVATLSDGYLVGGNQFALMPGEPGPAFWGVLLRLDPQGTVTMETNYFAEEDPTLIREVVAHEGSDGSVNAFAFVGNRHMRAADPVDPRAEWYVPWLWVVRTAPNFDLIWRNSLGVVSHQTEGRALVWDAAGLLVGGSDFTAPGMTPSSWEWVNRLSVDGFRTDEASYQPDLFGGVFGISPAVGNGYLLATTQGLIKVNAALEQEWRVADRPPEPGGVPDSFRAVVQAADGGIYAVGLRRQLCGKEPCAADLLVAKFDVGGTRLWSYVQGSAGKEDAGNDLVLMPGGGCAVVGSTASFGHGGSDLWLLRLTEDGCLDWDLTLGGSGDDYGYGLALAPDGALVATGQADVDGVKRMWVVKARSDLAAPVPVFAMSPASPVFLDQEVTFDASGSSAPGSELRRFEWDFGDGSPKSNATNTTHRFHTSGSYPVALTVENADGVRRSITNMVEVTGLVIQWERALGDRNTDTANSIVEARDGGYVLTGQKGERMWVFKTDVRGRPVWEQFFTVPESGEQEGRVVIRGQDDGYVIAGMDEHYSTRWDRNAWLVKVDEDGAPAWPEVRVFGEPDGSEEAWCVTAAADGGYAVLGERTIPGATTKKPWLIKTDPNGLEEWSADYQIEGSARGSWIVGLPDGGFAFTTVVASRPSFLVRTDASGVVIWTQVFDQYSLLNWVGLRNPPEDGLAMVGMIDRNIALQLLSSAGAFDGLFTWTGSTARRWSDSGEHAARTSDGGFLITGTANLDREGSTGPNQELTLIKTGPEGNLHWIEYLPGENTADEGIAAVTSETGGYVVLGRRPMGDSSIWLFRLAGNRPPTARMSVDSNPVALRDPVTFDGSGSSDPDGEIVSWEWAFDTDNELTGANVSHTFSEAGVHEVRLKAVDDAGGEDIITNTVIVVGVQVGEEDFVILDMGVVDCPSCRPELFPRSGEVPGGLLWDSALGFHVRGDAATSTTRIFRATFADSVPAGCVLYRLPDWEPMPFRRVEPHTIEVAQPTGGGEHSWVYLLAEVLPVPTISVATGATPARLALTIKTTPDLTYRVERTPAMVPAVWEAVPHALTPEATLSESPLIGDGETATLYVESPDTGAAFYRISVTAPGG